MNGELKELGAVPHFTESLTGCTDGAGKKKKAFSTFLTAMAETHASVTVRGLFLTGAVKKG